jgi:cobalamin biosynthesis Co2+ chelatase CbiK
MTKRNNLPAQQSNMIHWDKIVKQFPLSDNCMILTIKGSSVGHQKNMQDIANAINRTGFKNVVVGSVESFDHIQVMNEAQMKQVGWVRHITFRQFAAGMLRGISGRLKRRAK